MVRARCTRPWTWYLQTLDHDLSNRLRPSGRGDVERRPGTARFHGEVGDRRRQLRASYPPPILRGVRDAGTNPREVEPARHGSCVCTLRAVAAGVSTGSAAGCAASAAATSARTTAAAASSFARQQCLYLRPEPHRQGSLRPGGAAIEVIMSSECTAPVRVGLFNMASTRFGWWHIGRCVME